MPKVSKNLLPPKTQKEIMTALVRTLAKIENDALLRRFLDDLLTPTEKLMLGKRLMVAVLLQRGYSYGAVCRALKMSKTTVGLIQRELLKSGDGYKKIFDLFFRESRGQKILDTIERFLNGITFPVHQDSTHHDGMAGHSRSMRRQKRAL